MPVELHCPSCGKPHSSRTNDGSSLCPACQNAAFSAAEPMPVARVSSTPVGSGSSETNSGKNIPFSRCLTCFTLTYFMFLGLGLAVLPDWQHTNPGVIVWGGIPTWYGLFLFALVRSAIASSTIDETQESPSFKTLRRLATAMDEPPEIPSIQKKPRSRLWLAYFVSLWLALLGAIGLRLAIAYVPARPPTALSMSVGYSSVACIGTFAALLLFPINMLAFTARKFRGLAILLAIAGTVGFCVLIFFLGFFALLIMAGPTR